MEDQSNGNQYRIDLRQFMGGRPTIASPQFSSFIPLPSTSLPTELFPCHSGNQQHNYDLMMLMPRSGLNLQEFQGEHSAPGAAITSSTNMPCGGPTNAAAVASAATSSSCLLPHGLIGAARIVEGEVACFNAFGGVGTGDIGGTGRWPRQETLTLLEIRSTLDSKFKEANQKGPLWDEVSRIMAEEHGYQRSAKKCREKFENLYKYYKKTKEGKAGRQDGKHYRFFRQLEALYGEPNAASGAHESSFMGNAMAFQQGGNNSNQGNYSLEAFHSQKASRGSFSISESLEYETSTEEEDESTGTLGENENDTAERLRRKKKNSRTWKLKIKDFLDGQMKKLMERQEAWLLKLTNTLEEKEKERLRKEEEWRKREADRVDREHKFWAKEREWIEARDAALMEALQSIAGREVIIPSPEAMLTIRDQIHHQSLNAHDKTRGGEFKEGNKKRKENSGYFLGYESLYSQGDGGTNYCDVNGQCENNGPSPANSNAGNTVNDNCFRFLMSGNDGDNVWVAKEINNGR